MIGYLLVLYLGIVSVFLIDPNPLWSLPLVLVLIGMLWRKSWLSLTGVALYCIITAGKIPELDLNELPDLLLMVATIVFPTIGLVEVILSPKPYKVGKISITPIVITAGIFIGSVMILFFMIRAARIGVYINSDPTLQVFILMALSILLTGPVLLGSRPLKNMKDGLPSREYGSNNKNE